MNEFGLARGTDWFRKPGMIGLILLGSVAVAYVVATAGVLAGFALAFVPVAILFVSMVFINARIGWFAVLTLNFFALGIYRYIPQVTWGLTVDLLLALTYMALFFQSFHKKVEWGNAKNELTLIAAIWFGYCVLELVNPEAGSRIAWFYAVRGISMYMMMTVPLVLIIFNKPADLRLFLLIWGVFSILGSLKGMQQKFLGVDPWEQRWLDSGGAAQHLLFGQLRIFSFFSDAGTFGAAQGQSAVVFGILAAGEKNIRLRIFYAVVALLGLYGMMISGTRGALVVPITGLLLYIIMRKNIKVILAGAVAMAAVFVFFKYTYIGEGNGTIRRMRTAFNPEDASLQTRLENQRRLKVYLATRPFGGGLGSTGNIGQRYNPGTYLSTVPPDSWYVQIWMELGIVGLILHLVLLFYIVIKTALTAMFRLKNENVKTPVMAMVAGMFGIMAASYGNPVFGQMPIGIILYTCMVYMFLAPRFDRMETEAVNLPNQKPLTSHETG